MATSDAIAAVSETLEARLTSGLAAFAGPPVAQLHDLVDDVPSDPPTVTLFLYDILEEATVRNRPKPTRVVGDQLAIRKQPLGLRLMYMVTAWGGDRHTEQRLLGRVLQVMHDDAVLDGTDLRGALAGTSAQLRVTLAPLHLEDRSRVWYAINKPYRLSVNYEVRVVDVDVDTEVLTSAVVERQIGAGVPG